MVNMIRIITGIINDMHDSLIVFFRNVAPGLSDKDLHFWIMGAFGISFYSVVNFIFKRLAKWSIELVSFVYTMTVLLVVVFAIEIQQGITNRGVMDFNDIVSGITGFLAMFACYVFIKLIYILIRFLIRKVTHEDKTN